ncbi:MAG TPA: hypothetical protein GX497_05500 [Bacillus bacterium]|nr:hypothetical protein [Bacillus sp. (in: firmicutes)]
MKKVELTIEENIKYRGEVIIKQPNTMNDDELEEIVRKVEKECKYDSAKDVAYVLENTYGINVLEVSSGFPDSPDDSELEIVDITDI